MAGQTTFAGGLTVGPNSVGINTTSPAYTLDVAGTLRSTGAATLGGLTANLLTANALSANSLAVSNASTLSGLSANTLAVSNASTLGALSATSLAVSGGSTVGNISANNLSLGNAASVTGPLTVAGASTLSGGTTVGSTLSVTGATTLAGVTAGGTSVSSLAASGNVSANNLSVANVVSLTGPVSTTGNLAANNLSIGNAASITGPLTVAGTSALSGAATVGSTLSVTGATTLAGVTAGATSVSSLSASGNVTANNLSVANILSVPGGVSTTGNLSGNNLSISNAASVTGALTVTGTSTHTGATTVGSTLAVTGATTLAGLTAGAVSANTLNVSNNLSVAGTSNLGAVLLGNGGGGAMIIMNQQQAATATGFALYQGGGGDTVLNSGASVPLEFKIANVEKMRIDPQGNVGFGTQTPQYTVDVAGGARVGGILNFNNQLQNQVLSLYNNTDGANSASTSFYGFGINNGTLRYQVPGGQAHTWYSGSTIIANLTTSGQLGLACTNPQYPLDVVGSGRFSGPILGGTSTDTSSARGVSCLNSSLAVGNFYSLCVGQSATVVNQAELGFTYAGLGNVNNRLSLGLYGTQGLVVQVNPTLVGINTMAPAYTLDIAGSTRSQGPLIANIASFANAVSLVNQSFATPLALTGPAVAATGSGVSVDLSPYPYGSGVATVPAVRLQTADASGSGNSYIATFNILQQSTNGNANVLSSRVFINPIGYVGINTTAPAYTLDVAGTARVTGILNFNSQNQNQIISLYNTADVANSASTGFYGFGINGGLLRYQVPSGSNHTWFGGPTFLANLSSAGLTVSGNVSAVDTVLTGNLQIVYYQGIQAQNYASQPYLRSSFNTTTTSETVMFGAPGNHGSANVMTLVSNSAMVGMGINNPSPQYTLDVTGSSRVSGTILGGTSTDNTRAFSYLNSALGVGGVQNICLGQSSSALNQAELSFVYAGSGSSSNRLALGLFGYQGLSVQVNPTLVGINTQAPAYTLDVSGNARVTGILNFNNQVVNQVISLYGTDLGNPNSIAFFGLGVNAYTMRYQVPSGTYNHTWFQGSTCVANLTSTGQLGVNQSTPQYNLDVGGTMRVSGAANVAGTLTVSVPSGGPTGIYNVGYNSSIATGNAGGAQTEICMVGGAGAFSSSAAAGDGVLRVSGGGRLMLQTGPGNANVVIGPSGNVGIACTAPQYSLDVAGNVRATDLILTGNLGLNYSRPFLGLNAYTVAAGWAPYFVSNYNSSVGDTVLFGVPGNAGRANVLTLASSSSAAGSQQVGINTTAPAYTLDVTGNARATQYICAPNILVNQTGTTGWPLDVNGYSNFRNTMTFNLQLQNQIISLYNNIDYSNSASTSFYGFGVNLNTLRYQVPSSAQNHTWYAGSTVLANLTGSGQLGINTTTPAYNLDVTGNCRITNGLTAGGQTTLGPTTVGSGNFVVNNTGQFGAVYTGSTVYAQSTVTGVQGVVMNGYTAPNVQGTWLGWNRIGTGAAVLACQQGSGTGGFEFVQYNGSSQFTQQVAFLSSQGVFSTPGQINSAGFNVNNNPSSAFTQYNGGAVWNIGAQSTSSGSPGAFQVYNVNSNGVYLANGSTSWAQNSDMRLKRDITTMPSTSNVLTALQPVTYNWKTDAAGTPPRPGLIAQQVANVLPYVMSTGDITETCPDGALGIRYTELIPYLLQGFKELAARCDELERAQKLCTCKCTSCPK